MTPDESGGAEAHRLEAKRLISTLNDEELVALVGLLRGMSRQAIADITRQELDDLERTLSSLMTKLNAATIADAVRIGICAGVDGAH